MWYAIYSTATGALVSTGTVMAAPLPSGLASMECGDTQPTGEWNVVTHVFDAVTVLAPSWTVYEFMKLLTGTERMAIRALALTDPVVEDFMDLMQQSGLVHRANPDVAAGLAYLTPGVLAIGRSAEILNG